MHTDEHIGVRDYISDHREVQAEKGNKQTMRRSGLWQTWERSSLRCFKGWAHVLESDRTLNFGPRYITHRKSIPLDLKCSHDQSWSGPAPTPLRVATYLPVSLGKCLSPVWVHILFTCVLSSLFCPIVLVPSASFCAFPESVSLHLRPS